MLDVTLNAWPVPVTPSSPWRQGQAWEVASLTAIALMTDAFGVRPSGRWGTNGAAMRLGFAALLSCLVLAACSLGSPSPESAPKRATTSPPAPTRASSRAPEAAPLGPTRANLGGALKLQGE